MITLDNPFRLQKLVRYVPPPKHCSTQEVVLLKWVTVSVHLWKSNFMDW